MSLEEVKLRKEVEKYKKLYLDALELILSFHGR